MSTFINNFNSVFNTLRFVDIIDVLAVSAIFYYIIRFVRETRAMQLVKSLAVVFGIYFLSSFLNMVTLKFLLQKVLDVGLIMLVILFQPEIRRALERLGRSKITDIGKIGMKGVAEETRMEHVIDVLVDSSKYLAGRKDGALIVIERETKLGDIINTGTIIDADPSVELITNIFYKNTPLHDGAMIIRDGRVYAAGTYLPLSENDSIDRELGTRHRAALGVSEVSDALTIVVSEERGSISVTEESSIRKDISAKQLKELLHEKLIVSEEKKSFWSFWGKHK